MKKPLTLVSSVLWVALLSLQTQAAADADFFEKRIRPVLHDHCVECHGPQKQKGGLRVDSRAALLAGGESGAAVVPGNAEASLLIKAVRQADPDLKMPPPKAGPRLSESILADLTTWVRSGAAWPGENSAAPAAGKEGFDVAKRKARQAWLWQAPQARSVPVVSGHASATDVDRFLYARLEAKGLRAAGPADPATWLRRVNFAITGLPPAREELQRFLSDSGPEARERAVDRLLASPHFGERWARHWMDLMRYAESRGHESDFGIANAWQYRDYLIRAFNADVPYDQLVMEHVAGDLLPAPRLRPGTEINESVLATGWAFLGEEVHSPVDIRQDECERIDNKVDVFSKTFLGLTVSCARCHDHKFDPIRTDDYYALAGFMLSSSFRQVRFESMENNRRMAAELVGLRERFASRLARSISVDREAGVREIAAYLLAAGGVATPARPLGSTGAVETNRLQMWTAELARASTNHSHPLHRFAQLARDPAAGTTASAEESSATNRLGLIRPLPADARVVADFSQPRLQPWKVDGPGFGDRARQLGDLILGTDATHPIVRVMPYGAAGRDLFWNRLRTARGNENDSGRLGATGRSGQALLTPTFTLRSGRIHHLLRGKARVYAAVDSHLMNEGPLHAQLSQTLNSGPGQEPRWVTQDLTAYAGHRVHFEYGPDGAGELELLAVVDSAEVPSTRPEASLGIVPGAQTLSEFAGQFQATATRALERFGKGNVEPGPNDPVLAEVFNWLVANPQLFATSNEDTTRELSRQFLGELTQLEGRVQWESHTAVSLFDGTGVDEFVLVRGKPFKTGALSPRSLPVAFAAAKPLAVEASSGRYELAQQLVDPTNPLVSRTMVNRVWHHLFGRGIVPTVDNFGALGEPPTHPELLDYLSWRFMHQDGWSLKRLIRRLVLTEAFGRDSHPGDPRTEELDPSNVLLHRMAVRRLEAEVIRDSALAVSGRLNPAVGGPPIPVHLTEFLVGRGRPEQSGPLDGFGRRSVYLALRRNFIPTLMQTFDMPTPFSTVGRRNVTNVPAQSLALMNDPLFHEQARVWADRLLRETPGSAPADRVRCLYETAYARAAREVEIQACLASLDELARLHQTVAKDNLEVWGDLCHALLSANDFIYLR